MYPAPCRTKALEVGDGLPTVRRVVPGVAPIGRPREVPARPSADPQQSIVPLADDKHRGARHGRRHDGRLHVRQQAVVLHRGALLTPAGLGPAGWRAREPAPRPRAGILEEGPPGRFSMRGLVSPIWRRCLRVAEGSSVPAQIVGANSRRLHEASSTNCRQRACKTSASSRRVCLARACPGRVRRTSRKPSSR